MTVGEIVPSTLPVATLQPGAAADAGGECRREASAGAQRAWEILDHQPEIQSPPGREAARFNGRGRIPRRQPALSG